MNGAGSVSAGMKALQEVRQMPVTEACVSGLCDICLYQDGLCMTEGRPCANWDSSRRSAEQK